MAATTHRRRPGFFGDEARSDSSDTAVSVLQFWGPRYWRAWIMIGWLKLAACLPWRTSIALHKWFGRNILSKSRRQVKLVRENLALCFPELSEEARENIAMEFCENMGASIAEVAMAWFASEDRVRSLFEVQGVEHLERALERGKGVILSAGHFSTLEMTGPIFKRYVPWYTVVYNKRRSRLLSEYQRRNRERYSDECYPKGQVRPIVRSLRRRNGVVWFGADEAFREKSSVVVPFFGEPAPTSTATSRLAGMTGAAVVPIFFCRKADDSGYLFRFEPALEDFPTDDVEADTRRLTEILEDSIRECPAQYIWGKRRFRMPPESQSAAAGSDRSDA